MKLTQQLLSISEASALAKSNQDKADLLKAHEKAKKVSADQGVVQHINKDKQTGKIYVSDWYDSDETLATYNNGKLKEDAVTEASALHAVAAEHSEDGKGRKKADELEVGDEVEITGNVEHQGSIGTIEKFGADKKFVVVDIAKIGSRSFHSSDVSEASKDHEAGVFDDDEDADDEETNENTFYVAFYDEGEHASWIGCVTKEHGGKWHEEKYKGKPDHRWGGSYMSYLKPHEIMSWIHKDYRRGFDIEGPFTDPKEAEQYVEHNWGQLQEAVKKPRKPVPYYLEWDGETDGKEGWDNFSKAILSYVDEKYNGKAWFNGGDYAYLIDTSKPNQILASDDSPIKVQINLASTLDKYASKGTVKDLCDTYPEHWNEFFRPFKGLDRNTQADHETANMMGEAATLNMTIAEFRALVKETMVDIVDDYKEHAKQGQTSVPSAPDTSKFRAIKYGMIEYAPKTIVHGSYGMTTTYDMFIKIGSNVGSKIAKEMEDRFKADLSAENINLPKSGWATTTDGYQVRIDDMYGSAWSGFGTIVKAPVKEAQSYTDFEDWKQAVLNSYPQQAKRIKFKGRMEGNKDTISAEIPGEDRSYGVWDQDKEKGVVLSEGTGDDAADADLVKEIKYSLNNGDDYTARANIKLITNPTLKKEMQAYLKKAMAGELEEGVIDAVKGFVKHQSNMAKANKRGWEAFGKGMGAAIRDIHEKDPKQKAENERIVKQSVRDANRYRDFSQGGKGFSSTRETSVEKAFDAKVDKVKDAVKGAAKAVQRTVYSAVNKKHDTTWAATGKKGKHGQTGEPTAEWQELDKQGKPTGKREWRNMAGEYVGESNTLITSKQAAKSVVSDVKRKKSIVSQCAELAAEYWNDAYLQKHHYIDDYIEAEMKKRGITEGVAIAIAQVTNKVAEGISPFKPGAAVKIVSGPKDVVGKDGVIGEVKTSSGVKSFVIDYDHTDKGCKSVTLSSKDIKLAKQVKEANDADGEQLEVINKAHADHGAPKKVFFTGTREECYDFMRKHKSLKMDLMYKDSGRLASYVL